MFCYVRDRFMDRNPPNIRLKLIKRRDTNGRRYNLPTTSEVAVIIVDDINESVLDRDIIIKSRSNQLKRIIVDDINESVLDRDIIIKSRFGIQTSLQYDFDRTKKRKTIGMRGFFSYCLQIRSNKSPILLHSGRLFQQFLVNAYTMVEAECLSYYRFNQPKLRVEKYKVFHETFVSGEAAAVATGQRIILPSTITGDPMYMFNNCKDAFAICKYDGYPCFFITITSNPKCDKVKRLLRGTGLSPQDRPDIITRIFKLKLNNLISDFKMGRPFGRIVGYEAGLT
ncbi:hypothetical protein AHAS_Ahas16G0157800 [Arachis hypogaea]